MKSEMQLVQKEYSRIWKRMTELREEKKIIIQRIMAEEIYKSNVNFIKESDVLYSNMICNYITVDKNTHTEFYANVRENEIIICGNVLDLEDDERHYSYNRKLNLSDDKEVIRNTIRKILNITIQTLNNIVKEKIQNKIKKDIVVYEKLTEKTIKTLSRFIESEGFDMIESEDAIPEYNEKTNKIVCVNFNVMDSGEETELSFVRLGKGEWEFWKKDSLDEEEPWLFIQELNEEEM